MRVRCGQTGAAARLALAAGLLAIALVSTRPACASPGDHAAARATGHEVLVDQLEFRGQNGDDVLHGELAAWVGGGRHRLWLDASGQTRSEGSAGGEAELQLSYGHRVAGSWELRAGARHDRFFGEGPDRQRSFAAVDVSGRAAGLVDWTAAAFLSDDGDLSTRLTALGDLPLAARWILQPRFEVNVALHDVPRFGLARGLNDVELGLRLRYVTRGGVAPYLGASWIRALGNTADRVREQGDDPGLRSLVAGVRFAF